MKQYTQADFGTFEVDKFGRKICPTGDYTAIKDFVEYCVFDRHCLFDAQSRFIEHCRFGDGCYFGDGCSFGAYCYFGAGCDFGKECHFSDLCGFGEGSNFGAGCSFGQWCTFGECCNFGEGCSYEKDAVKNGRYVAVDRIGCANQKVYFYIDENGNMFVRAGCWFFDMAVFKEWVKQVHAGTIHEKTYLAACELAELMLKGGNEDYLQSSKRRMIMGEVKNYPPYLDYPKPYKAKTNADCIRTMSDEELANFLTDFSNNGGWITEIGRKCCYQTIVGCLQQPAEEADNE